MQKSIGIIGFGNMGSAIAEQLKGNYQATVFDKDSNKTKNLSGIKTAESSIDLTGKVSAVILAVKPQDFRKALEEILPVISPDKLIISIAAGITTGYIEKFLGNSVRVIRAMPNMPAKIGVGITCLSKGKSASIEDMDFAENLFSYLGETIRIEEDMMNAATAISGSGPAYVCEFLESEDFLSDFTQAAKELGFDDRQAELLTKTTYFGTKEFLKQTKISPEELVKQVASKGGTTEAALEALHKGASLKEAVQAALERAEELSKKGVS